MRQFSFRGLVLLLPVAAAASCAQVHSLPVVSRIDQSDRISLAGREQIVDATVRVSAQQSVGAIKPASHQSESGTAEASPDTHHFDDLSAEMPAAELEQASLSLSDLEEMALQHNPTLALASAVVDKARGVYKQVGLYPNPVIGYSGDEIGNNGTAGQQGGFVSQTIVTNGKLHLNRAVAAQNVQASSWELESQRYRVQSGVRLRFYEALGAQRRVRLALELQQVAEEGVKTAKLLVQAQQAARTDILQAQVQLSEVRIILGNAEYDHQVAWKQLASVVGRLDLSPVRLKGTLEQNAQELEWEQTYQGLLDSSPELQAAYAKVNRARIQIRRQQVQPTPNLLTQVNVAHDNSSSDTFAGVQIGVSLPIFNDNQGNIDIAVAEYHRALHDAERLKLSLRDRLAVTFGNYQKSRQQVERYRQDILPLAGENLNLTNGGYEQGEFDFLRVLTARRTFFQANIAYVRSLIGLRQAEVEISGLLLTGGLNDVPDISWKTGSVGQR